MAVEVNHPDRIKWNSTYEHRHHSFDPHPIVEVIQTLSLPHGDVLELAAGPSGTALSLAKENPAGGKAWAVDISDVAIRALECQAHKNGLVNNMRCLVADLESWHPPEDTFSLICATRFWDPKVFVEACQSVMMGGYVVWETFTLAEQNYRPSFKSKWCWQLNEPVKHLPLGFCTVILEDKDDGHSATRLWVGRKKFDGTLFQDSLSR